MTPWELAKLLNDLGKKGVMPNWRENELLKKAAATIEDLARKLGEAMEKIDNLEERLAIVTEDQQDPDTDFPPREDLAATDPDQDSEDFWGDDWPLFPGK